MRRVLATFIAGVLIGALWLTVAFSGSFGTISALPKSPDLLASFGLRVFGRAPGSNGYLSTLPPVPHAALAYGRVFSLHDVTDRYSTFEVRQLLQPAATATPANGLIALNRMQKYTGPVLIGSTTIAPDKPAGISPPAPVASVQPLSASQTVASLNQPSSASLSDDTSSAFDSRMQDSSMSVSMPIRVGAFTVKNINSSAQFSEAPSSDVAVHNYTWTAATNFDVQAKRRAVNVNLNTDYEHVNTSSVASFAYNVNSSAPAISDLQAVNPALFTSSANAPVDLTAHGIAGGLALPLNHRVTLGLQYGAQRFTGSYGLTATPNLDTSKYSYLGNVTFALRPNTAITLSARQYHYQDNLVPSNSYFQTRADLNFTVKL